jgi:hypothetical protein
MSFPSFLGPLTPLFQLIPPVLPLGGNSVDDGPIGGAGANQLAFSMQAQQESNWCWAANTSSVSVFFDSTSQWTQCAVASACLGESCCTAPMPCNQAFVLDVPLSQTNNLQGSAIATPDSRTALQEQIDGGSPVCCHISWAGQGGHFVTVSGYDWSTDDVIVDDPLYGPGPARVPYNTFVSSYRGAGCWDYSYHTHA